MAGKQSWVWKGVWSRSSTGLHWRFCWATSHLISHPQKWSSLSQIQQHIQRHMVRAALPNSFVGFPHPSILTQPLANLLQGLLLFRETSQVLDKLEPNICSAKSPGNQREKGKPGEHLSGADSLPKPPFSASSHPSLWLTKDDVRDVEVTKSFPCIWGGRSALNSGKAALGLGPSWPHPRLTTALVWLSLAIPGSLLVFADWWFPHSS